VSLPAAAAIVVATMGVMLVSFPPGERTLRAFFVGWTSRTAMLGLASGGFFAISAVGYRGGALSLETPSVVLAAAATLVWAQAMQSVALGGWLLVRAPAVIQAVLRAWRVSLLAGLMGALASMGWFTAMAMEPVAHVRTLGLVELLFSYAISLKVFREKLGRMEVAGMALLVLGLVGILNFR
jgi:drug/metabolite transporter (DMT)-like permease